LIFNDIMKRSKLSSPRLYQNQTIIIPKKDDGTVAIIVEPDLWAALMETEFKDTLQPFDPAKDLTYKDKFTYFSIMNDDWIPIDPEKMYSGDLVHLKIEGFEYTIPINVKIFPVKLRKTEFTNFSYQVIRREKVILVVRKKFETPIPNTAFTMNIPYQVI